MIVYSPEELFVYEWLTRERVFSTRDQVEAESLKVHDGLSRAKIKRLIIRRLQAEVSAGLDKSTSLRLDLLPGLVEKELRGIVPDLFKGLADE